MKPAFRSLLAFAVITGPAVAQEHAPAERMSSATFRSVESGGQIRPVISASFNGHPFDMMLHSMARFPGGEVQLRHAQAREFGVTELRKGPRYGIDRPGHASDLGSQSGRIADLAVGRTIDHNAPISVFEVPQTDLGMIGIDWMRRQRVIIDFSTHQATIAPTASHVAGLNKRLTATGYRAIHLLLKGGFYEVRVSVNGVARNMTIGSASHTVIDAAFAATAGVGHGKEAATGFGPTGTRALTSDASNPVVFEIDGWRSPAIERTAVNDVYGYMAMERPANAARATGGTLGDTFLMATGAVIDLGSGTLYVRNQAPRT